VLTIGGSATKILNNVIINNKLLLVHSRHVWQTVLNLLSWPAENCFPGSLHKQPRKPFSYNFLEWIIEDTVEHRVGYWRKHSKEERQGVSNRSQDCLLWKDLRGELVEDGVQDERAPADEEDSSDAAQQDVGSAAPAVHLRVLAWRPGRWKMLKCTHILSSNLTTDVFTGAMIVNIVSIMALHNLFNCDKKCLIMRLNKMTQHMTLNICC